MTATFADARVLRLRPIQAADVFAWYECKADWPRDRKGVYTLQRAFDDTERNLRSNEQVTRPLTAESRWIETLVAHNDDGLIAVARHRALGTHCHVLQQAVHPAHRGAGWFSALNEALSVYAFDVLGADVVTHEIVESAAAAKTYVSNREQYARLADTVGETGRTLQAGRMRAAAFRRWAEANPDRIPTLEFEP